MRSSRRRQSLHGFGGVVDEVAEGALDGFGVGEDEREIGREVLDEADVCRRPAKRASEFSTMG